MLTDRSFPALGIFIYMQRTNVPEQSRFLVGVTNESA